MKRSTKYLSLFLLSFFMMAGSAFAQQFDRELQYFTSPDQSGLNQFEAPFQTDVEFDGLNVRIGGANTLQFQGLSQENSANSLPSLETNFNLPTSNLDLDVGLDNGLRMHLRTYLSSQHHTETYVKGGYMQVDRLDFVSEGFASELMDHVRIKVGLMEINYGDNHFRRTDNADAIHNPFVGNYIMDSFTTEVGGEIYVYGGDLFGMIGLSNGKMNQSVLDKADNGFKTKPSFYAKLGYDNNAQSGLRFRLTGSLYTTSQNSAIHLYDGDRAGSRYYSVMEGSFRAGRFAPAFNPGHGQPAAAGEITSFMINPFVKYGGLEFYGVIENVSGKMSSEPDTRNFTQIAGELLYRFGASQDIYLGTRYNVVDGESIDGDIQIDRFNIGGGWFMTKNVLAKLEYVTQSYDGAGFDGSLYEGASFNGVMLEAVISF